MNFYTLYNVKTFRVTAAIYTFRFLEDKLLYSDNYGMKGKNVNWKIYTYITFVYVVDASRGSVDKVISRQEQDQRQN